MICLYLKIHINFLWSLELFSKYMTAYIRHEIQQILDHYFILTFYLFVKYICSTKMKRPKSSIKNSKHNHTCSNTHGWLSGEIETWWSLRPKGTIKSKNDIIANSWFLRWTQKFKKISLCILSDFLLR